MELFGMVLFAFGCYRHLFPVVLLGNIIMVSALTTVVACQKVVLNNAMDSTTFAAMYGWTGAFRGLGQMAASYILPMFPIRETLPVLIGMTAFDVLLNICLERSVEQPPKEPAQGVCTILEEKASPKAMRALPFKYWLLAAAGGLCGSLVGQVQFGPYILQKRGGLSQQKANQIMGLVPICALLLAPVCGTLFAKRERLRGPLFVFAATAHVLGQSLGVIALSSTHWIFEVEAVSWLIVGVGLSIFKCGASGLVPETIKGKPELMATASSMQAILGDGLQSATVQLSFMLSDHSFLAWRALNQLLAAAIMADAVAIWIYSPLAPDQDGDSEEEDGDSDSSSDSKGLVQ